MNQQSLEKVKPQIEQFVTAFNNDKKFENFPIVGFQFVSLDNLINGNMIWWNYLHEKISSDYIRAVEEFTGLSENHQLRNTLIDWESDEQPFWYRSLGEKKILELVTNDFILSDNCDNNVAGKGKPVIEEKKQLLNHWQEILIKVFNKSGSTLWVSIPHEDLRGVSTYSSVFILFNESVPEQEDIRLDIYRLIRNFIINYIIDFYRAPLVKRNLILTRQIVKDNVLGIEDFKPVRYNIREDSESSIYQLHMSIDKRMFSEGDNLKNFKKQYDEAFDRIKTHFNIANNRFVQPENAFPWKYLLIKTMRPGDFNKIIFLFYGRFIILAAHCVFKLTLKECWHALINKPKPPYTFSDFQNRMAIEGLRNDIVGPNNQEVNNLNLDLVIPFISEAEFRFLVAVCAEFNQPMRLAAICRARELAE